MGWGSKPTTELQVAALVLGHVFALVALILVIKWASNPDTDKNFLGGLHWDNTYVFNFHPVLTVAGLVVAYTESILAYRTWPFGKHINKALHFGLQSLAVVLMAVGLRAVWRYKDDGDKANLASMHSWLGIATVALFCANYVGGILMFYLPVAPPSAKAVYLPLHVFVGIFCYVLACFTAASGIQEENVWLGCTYSVSSQDKDPALFYTHIPLGCRVSNGLAYVIVMCCMCTMYAVMDLQVGAQANPKPEDDNANSLLGRETEAL